MLSDRVSRIRTVVAGGLVLAAVGAFAAACGTGGQSPVTTTTTPTTTTASTAPPSATEKGVSPTGGNQFTPGVTARPAPTVPPGQHPGINGIP